MIEKTFGWNESFQKNRFETKYEPDWFYWIESSHKRIGYICFYETNTELHVSLLVIFDAFRNKAYGSLVMNLIHERAQRKSLKITLSSFKVNVGAVQFYKKLGYQIIAEDEHFYDLTLVAQ